MNQVTFIELRLNLSWFTAPSDGFLRSSTEMEQQPRKAEYKRNKPLDSPVTQKEKKNCKEK